VTFETMAAERLAATRARLDSLQGELPHSTGELQAAMQVRAAQLAAERDSATRRLALLKSATDDEWQTMRLAVADALDSLETRIDRLSDQLRKPSRSGRPRA
jgi:transposase